MSARRPSRLLVAWGLLVFGLAVRSFAGGVLPPAAGAWVESITIDPNLASVAELQVLPGVGPERAAAIVLERIRGGPFGDPADLLRVRGLGPSSVAAMAPFLSFVAPVPAPGR